jgi:hypothetical protein
MKGSPSRPTFTALVLAAACLLGPAVGAHDVIVDQVVAMRVQPRNGQLLVHLHVPATALGDAKLPLRDDGTLDPAADRQIDVVAADIARNLDIWRDGAPFAVPTVSAAIASDRKAIDVDLVYALAGEASGLSARLNTFTGTPLNPVRTDVAYVGASGAPLTLSVKGAPARVAFDPGALDVVQDFLGRALRVLLDGGNHLLFFACLLLPALRLRGAAAAFAAVIGGQVAGMLTALALSPGRAGSVLPAAALIAASAVAIAALQAIVSSRRQWILLLAGLFGVLNGLAFGGTLAAARQFGGAHTGIALATFVLVVAAGEAWLGAIAWATRVWLDGRGAPDRMLTLLAGALIIHTAVHRVADRATVLSQTTGFGAAEAMAWLTVGWAVVMLAIALIEAFRQRGARRGAGRLAGSVQV